ncbi:MAG TPA: tetratricopeptide repeat protein [Candidatus Polarisedimenticolia bacterium]|nr:tetratricopeptide repeat protein [Candidatus Polarisedimenticolia bacterium]
MNSSSGGRVLALAAVVSLMLGAAPALAQEDNQRCEGTVTDDQGNPLAGATISFLDIAFNRPAQPVKTSKKGKYAHNVLRAAMEGYEIKATLEGYRIVKITALTTKGDGTRVTDDSYMVGFEQKGLHKVLVPPQSRSDATSKGRCVVDFIMAPEDTFNAVFHRLQGEHLAKEGKAPPAGADQAAPGQPAAQAAAPVPAEPKARDPLDACAEVFASRDYAGSVAPCKEAVAAKPDSAEAHRYLGSALLQQDNVAEAEPALKKALELDASVAGGNFDMGSLYIKKGRFMQAIPHFEKEHEANPQSEAVLQNLAKLYADTEQTDKAIAAYEKLIAQVPDRIENYGLLADAYKATGNTDKELEVYKRMGTQDPSGRAFYNLGNIMFNKSEMDKAAEAYKKAIEQAPDHADAHYQLGMAYVNLGKLKEAVVELEAFVKLKPKDPRAPEAKTMASDLRKLGG